MRHTPTAYKFMKPSVGQFFHDRIYQARRKPSVDLQCARAWGLKLMQSSQFMSDQSIPDETKKAVSMFKGQWVIFLPTGPKTLIMRGDDPAKLCELASFKLQHKGA